MPRSFVRALAVAVALLAAGTAAAQARSDAAREKRHADQVVGSLVVGEAVWLQAAQGNRFLALLAAPDKPKAAVMLAHGPGLHPDHGITGELRMHLFDRGFTTLSLQMPVLPPEQEAGDAYRTLYPEAGERLDAGLRYLQGKGFARVAIVSHAMGSGMTFAWLRRQPGAPLFAWAALSFYGDFDDLPRVGFPVFDIFGASDYRGIRGPARARKHVLDALPGSKQLAVKEGGRFLAGGSAVVLTEVAAFLEGVLP